MVSYHREIANQTLKNQTTSNVKIRCRLEKTGKTEKLQQAGDTNPATTDPLKTISMGSIADGLIFKGLIFTFRFVTGYSAKLCGSKPLKIRPLPGLAGIFF
jgi:hypothetical protein